MYDAGSSSTPISNRRSAEPRNALRVAAVSWRIRPGSLCETRSLRLPWLRFLTRRRARAPALPLPGVSRRDPGAFAPPRRARAPALALPGVSRRDPTDLALRRGPFPFLAL